MSFQEYKHYIKPFDTFISSKVIFHDYLEDEDTIIELFYEYQIKWFNQQTEDYLHDYFYEVIAFYKAEEEFLSNASSLLEMQRELSNGLNYGIVCSDDYAQLHDENDEDMWILQGWKNNYGMAVVRELERVLEEFQVKYNLRQEQERKESA
jgi:hypothetical protein